MKPFSFKGLVHPKIKMMSLMTHLHGVPSLQDLRSSSEDSFKIF